MCSRDLLRKPILIEGKVLDQKEFFSELQKSMKEFSAVGHEPVKSELDAEQVDDRVRSYVRLCRAAITTLAGEKDFDTVDYILKLHSIRSREILQVGKGLAIGEFGILQIHKDTQDELDQEIEEIRKMQQKITRPAIIRFVAQHWKYKQAALFQGLEGMTDFYYSHYGRWSEKTSKRKGSDG